jgi:hypothetical protein
MDDTDNNPLRCPKCKAEGHFKIAATVWIKVDAVDSLTIIDEGGDREYGSEDACRCEGCDHQARLGDFYPENQDGN